MSSTLELAPWVNGTYPVVVRQPDVTVPPVVITGPPGVDASTPWATWHETAAIVSRRPGTIVDRAHLEMVGDGFSASGDAGGQADRWTLSGVRMGRVHDDAIENDRYRSGLVDDCLIDGAMVFLSELYGSGNVEPDGSAELVTVHRSLVRLAPYENSYNPPKYGTFQHGGLFKWATSATSRPTPLELAGNVFAVEMVPKYGGTIDLPNRPNVTARGNVLVWLGPGSWPEAHLVRWRAADPELVVLAGWDAWRAAVAVWESHRPT